MHYFDHSATSLVNKEVLEEFKNKFMFNGTKEEFLLLEEKVKKILNTNLEVIWTSGSSESNNLAIKGIVLNHPIGSHIITTSLEHSSINETLKHLEKKGYIIDYVKLNNGVVDIKNLENMITEKTILVTIASVNSELGILQPIDKIGNILKKYENIVFHSDMTQSIGKIKINLENVDLVSFSSHKFNGIKGAGVLLKRKDIDLKKIIYGTRTYNYALISSMVKALEISYSNIDNNYNYVLKLNNRIRESLKENKNIIINSVNSIPHILNISVLNFKPETFVHYLEQFDIYISTKSACSISNDYSSNVYDVTNNIERAQTSVRISLSSHNTIDEVDKLINILKNLGG